MKGEVFNVLEKFFENQLCSRRCLACQQKVQKLAGLRVTFIYEISAKNDITKWFFSAALFHGSILILRKYFFNYYLNYRFVKT